MLSSVTLVLSCHRIFQNIIIDYQLYTQCAIKFWSKILRYKTRLFFLICHKLPSSLHYLDFNIQNPHFQSDASKLWLMRTLRTLWVNFTGFLNVWPQPTASTCFNLLKLPNMLKDRKSQREILVPSYLPKYERKCFEDICLSL